MIKKVDNYYIALCLLLLFPVCMYSVIDRIVATIHVGLTPSAIAITPDGHFAYVTNTNSNDVVGYTSVSVIDLQTNQVVKTIQEDDFSGPTAIVINKQGTKVYVANEAVTTVAVIDTATNTIEAVINGFNGPSAIVLTPDGTKAYVSNGSNATVSVVDLASNMIIGAPIVVGVTPEAIAITPDGNFVYVVNFVSANPGDGSISVISTATNTVIQTIKANFVGPSNIIIDAAGKYAYIANTGGDLVSDVGRTVSVLNLKTNKVVDTFKVGIQPNGLAISPNGRFLYVTNSNVQLVALGAAAGVGIVNVVDIITRKVLEQELLVGFAPARIAISSDGMHAYVTNNLSDTVSVLDINDQMWLYKKLVK